MYFAAGVAAKAVLLLFVLGHFQDQVFSLDEDPECIEDCGGGKARHRATRNGELLCFSEDRYIAKTSCEMKCYKITPDEDQLQCWKTYCAFASLEFCEKPGMPSIYKDQCEEYLNAGKVKYYGIYCPDFEKFLKEPSQNSTRDPRAWNRG